MADQTFAKQVFASIIMHHDAPKLIIQLNLAAEISIISLLPVVVNF